MKRESTSFRATCKIPFAICNVMCLREVISHHIHSHGEDIIQVCTPGGRNRACHFRILYNIRNKEGQFITIKDNSS